MGHVEDHRTVVVRSFIARKLDFLSSRPTASSETPPWKSEFHVRGTAAVQHLPVHMFCFHTQTITHCAFIGLTNNANDNNGCTCLVFLLLTVGMTSIQMSWLQILTSKLNGTQREPRFSSSLTIQASTRRHKSLATSSPAFISAAYHLSLPFSGLFGTPSPTTKAQWKRGLHSPITVRLSGSSWQRS